MGIKKSLTPLSRVSMLTKDQIDALGTVNIDTAEELYGMVTADHDKAGSFLHLESADLDQLETELADSLDPDTRASFEAKTEQKIAYGARIPPKRVD